jgi:hypothetical protein
MNLQTHLHDLGLLQLTQNMRYALFWGTFGLGIQKMGSGGTQDEP